jgi:hypothetical protein
MFRTGVIRGTVSGADGDGGCMTISDGGDSTRRGSGEEVASADRNALQSQLVPLRFLFQAGMAAWRTLARTMVRVPA